MLRSVSKDVNYILALLIWCLFVNCLDAFTWRYETREENSKFQKIKVETKTGDVFIAGRNAVYRLDRFLKLKDIRKTGPIRVTESVGLSCPGGKNACVEVGSERYVDNNADVLEMGREFLLFCGSFGVCYSTLLSSSDLKHLVEINNSDYNEIGRNVVALSIERDTISSEWNLADKKNISDEQNTSNEDILVFVAKSYNNASQLEYNLPSISAYSLTKFQHSEAAFHTYVDSRKQNFSPNKNSGRSNFRVNYVFAFHHDGFSYFLKVQRGPLTEGSNYETRLARVCVEDPRFESYSEIEIVCRKKNSFQIFYNVAITATLDTVGKEFSDKFEIEKDELALYIILGKGKQNSDEVDYDQGFGICIYTMSDISKEFVKIQQDCYRGNGRLLDWNTIGGRRCTPDVNIATKIDAHFCGNSKNVGIESRYPLSTVTNATVLHHVPTSVLISHFRGKTIAIVGTNAGYLLKILIDGTNSEPYMLFDVGSGLSEPAVANEMTFDFSKEHVYLLTGSRVTKFLIRSCSVYSDCRACLTPKDPLDCGWCGDHCSTQADCSFAAWSNNTCAPVIEDFHPKSGPVEGGTHVTIVGQNFGTGLPVGNDVKVTVLVALSDCALLYRNTTCLACLTGRSISKVVNREIKLTIHDGTRTSENFIIHGTVTSGGLTYAFKIPSVTSILPLIGPESGGTMLTVSGQNLDIGSNQSIEIGSQPCLLQNISQSSILCQTPGYIGSDVLKDGSNVRNAALSAMIDGRIVIGSGKVFQYKSDPSIHQLSPKSSILSGGMKITVSGTNLHIARTSRILFQVPGKNSEPYMEDCVSNEVGSRMICLSPNLTTSSVLPTVEIPLVAQVSFKMDGVRNLSNGLLGNHLNNSSFLYVADPEFSTTFGPRHKLYDDENYLEIQGKSLNLAATSEDYLVTIGGARCNITHLSSSLLMCQPERSESQKPLLNVDLEVQVKVGRLIFCIGFLQFSARNSTLHDYIYLIAALGAALIIFLLICSGIIYCTCGSKNKYKQSGNGRPRFESDSSQHDPLITAANSRSLSYSLSIRSQSQTESLLDLTDALRIMNESKLFVAKNRLTLHEIIGQGHFGCVYRGVLKDDDDKSATEVAVKTLKIHLQDDRLSDPVEVTKFFHEALRMREFDHPNILRLIGLALDDNGIPLVILPFMVHGDLLSYIRNVDNSPTVKELMEFGIQIAEGMSYLSNLKFVHRDLAARNCMLDDDMNVKIADFGLSRDIYERDYYSCNDQKTRLPVKWMALESLEKGIYNWRTDVWSYGIVLWELMTRGVCPYPDVDNWDIVHFLKSGRRMSQPMYCPDNLYGCMLDCWNPIASMRPRFDHLVFEIRQLILHMELPSQSTEPDATYVNSPEDLDYLHPVEVKPLPQVEDVTNSSTDAQAVQHLGTTL